MTDPSPNTDSATPDPSPFNPTSMFEVPEETLVDEGQSSFGQVDQNVSFGAPAETAEDEATSTTSGFANTIQDSKNNTRTPSEFQTLFSEHHGFGLTETSISETVDDDHTEHAIHTPNVYATEPVVTNPNVHGNTPYILSNQTPELLSSPTGIFSPPTNTTTAGSVPLGNTNNKTRKRLLVGAAILALAATAGSVIVGARFLSGGGAQPDDAIPGTAVAVMRIDFDPSVEQKIAVAKFAREFPAVNEQIKNNSENIKDAAFSALFRNNTLNVNYETDVKPWLGNRAAITAVPDATAKTGFDAALIISFTNEKKMRETLDKIIVTAQNDNDPKNDFGYAVTKNKYVVLSDTTQNATSIAAASEKSSLSDNVTYQQDTQALGGNQVAAGWVDMTAVQEAVKAANVSEKLLPSSFGTKTGRIVFGTRIADNTLETVALARGVTKTSASEATNKPGSGMVGNLPEDTLGAFSVVGLDAALTEGYQTLQKNDSLGILGTFETETENAGLSFPEDFSALFGHETLIAGSGDNENPKVAVRIKSTDPTRSQTLITKLVNTSGQDGIVEVLNTPDGYVLSNDKQYSDIVSSGTGTLKNSKEFQNVVVNPDNASAVAYVNIARIYDALKNDDDDNMKRLQSVGVSATKSGEDSKVTIRLSVR